LGRTRGDRARDALQEQQGTRVGPEYTPEKTLVLYDATNNRYILARADPNGNLLVSATVPAGVDVTDRWARQLGMIDLERYLGVACGPANPLDNQTIVGGAVIDPRQIRALVAADIVTVNNLLNPHPVTHANFANLDVLLSSRASEATVAAILARLDVALSTRASQATVASILAQLDVALSSRASEATLASILAKLDNPLDPMVVDVNNWPATYDVSDRAARLLGIVYGSQGAQLLQRAATFDSLVQLRDAGVEIDPRQIRLLTAADVVDVSDKPARQLGLVTTVMENRTYDHTTFDSNASGNIVAGVAGKVIKVHGLTIQAQGTVTVNINNGAGGASLAEWSFQAREGVVYAFTPYPAHWFQTSVATALYATLSAAIVVTMNVIYTDDDAS